MWSKIVRDAIPAYSIILEHVGYVYTNVVGLSCVIISDREYPQRVVFALINRVLDDFTNRHPREEWVSADAALPFPEMKRMLEKYQNPHEADPIMRVQKELDETKVVLVNEFS